MQQQAVADQKNLEDDLFYENKLKELDLQRQRKERKSLEEGL